MQFWHGLLKVKPNAAENLQFQNIFGTMSRISFWSYDVMDRTLAYIDTQRVIVQTDRPKSNITTMENISTLI